MTTTSTNYCALYMRTSANASASEIDRLKTFLLAEIEKRSINDGPDAWKVVDFYFDNGLSAFAVDVLSRILFIRSKKAA